MINIDDSNVVKCPHCGEELDAYQFDGFVDSAINDGGVCEGSVECPECEKSIFLEVLTNVSAIINVKPFN